MLFVIWAHQQISTMPVMRQNFLRGVWDVVAAHVLAFLVLTILAYRTVEGTRSISDMLKWAFEKFHATFTLVCILVFCFVVDRIQRVALDFADSAVKSDWQYQFIGVFVPLV